MQKVKEEHHHNHHSKHHHSEHHNHHEHHGHGGHGGHDKHAGHSPEIFKRRCLGARSLAPYVGAGSHRFFICLILTLPVLYFSTQLQTWLGYQAIEFPGSSWVNPILGIIIYFYGGWVFLRGAWRELHSKVGMMTLIALAITVAFVYSLAVSLGLQGKPFYWELVTLVDIMLLGHWVEMASVKGASQALESLKELVPANAHLWRNGRVEDIPVTEVKADDTILIRPGEQIPNDGEVVEGSTEVDEAFLTGESRPIPKQEGNEVVAGSVNSAGSIKVRVTRTGDETTLSQITRLVEEAQNSRSNYQALADRIAYWLTIIAIAAGTLTFVVWLSISDLVFAINRAVTVLVITCPHALGLAIPLVIANSTALAAKNGILVRNRDALERAKDIKTMAFDKTGTLTEGHFGVQKIYVDGMDEDEALAIAAALETSSEHPLGKAIIEAAEFEELKLPQMTDFETVVSKVELMAIPTR